jgi:hypothetical protein
MLIIIGAVTVFIAAVIIPTLQMPAGVNAATLGRMSEQWLTEHRASHPV